jgi:Spy/CpxP family protein refolding chaperone
MNHALMKPAVLLASISLLASLPLAAQHSSWDGAERGHGPPSAEQKLLRLTEALDLSDEQSLRLLEVLQATRADHELLHARMLDAFGGEICALKAGAEADILAILTPEQAARFQFLKQERVGKREAKRDREPLDCPVDQS